MFMDILNQATQRTCKIWICLVSNSERVESVKGPEFDISNHNSFDTDNSVILENNVKR